MALGLKPAAVYGVVNSLRKTSDKPLLVAGVLADVLARELVAGGDTSAVRVGSAVDGAEALVYVVGDSVSDDDERVLKAARRARVPIIVVAAGREAPLRVPFVLATDVVRVPTGHGFPLEEIGRALMHKLGEEGSALAARLPVLRRAFCTELIESMARKNAAVGVATFIPGADLPVLTINQIRMVLRICAAYGLEVDAQRAPEMLGTIGAGIGFRAVAREFLGAVPVAGWVVKGALAYVGTRTLGEAAVRYCETRTRSSTRRAAVA